MFTWFARTSRGFDQTVGHPADNTESLYERIRERLGNLTTGIKDCLEMIRNNILRILGIHPRRAPSERTGFSDVKQVRSRSSLDSATTSDAKQQENDCNGVSKCKGSTKSTSPSQGSCIYKQTVINVNYKSGSDSGNEADSSDLEGSGCCFRSRKVRKRCTLRRRKKASKRHCIHDKVDPAVCINACKYFASELDGSSDSGDNAITGRNEDKIGDEKAKHAKDTRYNVQHVKPAHDGDSPSSKVIIEKSRLFKLATSKDLSTGTDQSSFSEPNENTLGGAFFNGNQDTSFIAHNTNLSRANRRKNLKTKKKRSGNSALNTQDQNVKPVTPRPQCTKTDTETFVSSKPDNFAPKKSGKEKAGAITATGHSENTTLNKADHSTLKCEPGPTISNSSAKLPTAKDSCTGASFNGASSNMFVVPNVSTCSNTRPNTERKKTTKADWKDSVQMVLTKDLPAAEGDSAAAELRSAVGKLKPGSSDFEDISVRLSELLAAGRCPAELLDGTEFESCIEETMQSDCHKCDSASSRDNVEAPCETERCEKCEENYTALNRILQQVAKPIFEVRRATPVAIPTDNSSVTEASGANTRQDICKQAYTDTESVADVSIKKIAVLPEASVVEPVNQKAETRKPITKCDDALKGHASKKGSERIPTAPTAMTTVGANTPLNTVTFNGAKLGENKPSDTTQHTQDSVRCSTTQGKTRGAGGDKTDKRSVDNVKLVSVNDKQNVDVTPSKQVSSKLGRVEFSNYTCTFDDKTKRYTVSANKKTPHSNTKEVKKIQNSSTEVPAGTVVPKQQNKKSSDIQPAVNSPGSEQRKIASSYNWKKAKLLPADHGKGKPLERRPTAVSNQTIAKAIAMADSDDELTNAPDFYEHALAEERREQELAKERSQRVSTPDQEQHALVRRAIAQHTLALERKELIVAEERREQAMLRQTAAVERSEQALAKKQRRQNLVQKAMAPGRKKLVSTEGPKGKTLAQPVPSQEPKEAVKTTPEAVSNQVTDKSVQEPTLEDEDKPTKDQEVSSTPCTPIKQMKPEHWPYKMDESGPFEIASAYRLDNYAVIEGSGKKCRNQREAVRRPKEKVKTKGVPNRHLLPKKELTWKDYTDMYDESKTTDNDDSFTSWIDELDEKEPEEEKPAAEAAPKEDKQLVIDHKEDVRHFECVPEVVCVKKAAKQDMDKYRATAGNDSGRAKKKNNKKKNKGEKKVIQLGAAPYHSGR